VAEQSVDFRLRHPSAVGRVTLGLDPAASVPPAQGVEADPERARRFRG